ncbi:endonuclease/exonuclease/phosphatase family protein [Microlunatus soli]|uniref:Uncharacterized conserved protein YafD, endonuclease/exonuclease/phosphatase (EEP) superfamily n=1 Tax=Microlunatus soli TaxID=630515 RepID=A0A1H1YKP4_9ACTN|nr:endonuclease/exonuclease/phosphatase family protein [Microlunatus soli]SDT21982.1 Uncharacterized conserved protein YafD, endonuclease/exonuclease/phosphatase (EEP) superfamily [Microlunatus soli]
MTGPPPPVSVYRSPEARPLQSLWVSIGILTILPGIAAGFLYLVPPENNTAAMVAAFIPYGLVADLIATVCFAIALVRARRRLALALLTGVSALLLIMQLIWIGPQFVADRRPARTAPFTVASLNMKIGSADVDQIRSIAERVDILILVEVTPTAYTAVRDATADRLDSVVPAGISSGNQSMILSRFTLTDAKELRSTSPQWSATVAVPGIGPVNLIAAHPCNPFCGGDLWVTEHRSLLSRAEQLDGRPEVIAGDFNATSDHRPLRRLERHGFVSATDIVGRGWLPTYPANVRLLPPLIQIDHVLVNRRLTVTAIDTFPIDGTDHLGLITRLAGA